ncbi:hypothetical protein C9J03_04055 [Photobacterium gaetbulicola]|uniref:Insecticide toxin TcdB middle/N-terminal domain-containing protein n=1 Tax=Photobacterium gaetbulicola Gung47 TaxID=658445 RepID=A0A0C5WI32_9GAMM|nr:RHS repeat-associated core domain-containing protein [Photobacterium gaetbulicola]AJR06773.1 hypothetical protein H744_1c1755 [Photobacterium gaetbulicola Gung47]PSU14087.1 hypothetical protein C9J03_04055 [Photobacterium gaetbulicola]
MTFRFGFIALGALLSLPALSSTITHQSGVGVIQSEYRINDGSVNYTIPITVPKGITDFSPQLSLNYNHNLGQGSLGVGWTLGGPSMIERCDKIVYNAQYREYERQRPELTKSDIWCIDGTPLVQTNATRMRPGTRGATFQLESDPTYYIEVKRDDNWGPTEFEIVSRDGIKHTYKTPVYATDFGRKPSKLLLTSSIPNYSSNDRSAITYHYSDLDENGDQYARLERVSYAGGDVVFNWNINSSVKPSWYHGRRQSYNYYLSSVDVRGAATDKLLWRYGIQYTTDNHTGLRYVDSVSQCNGEDCLPPLVFEYAWQSNESNFTLSKEQNFTAKGYKFNLVNDITGNGIKDFIGVDNNGLIYISKGYYKNGILSWEPYKKVFSDANDVMKNATSIKIMDVNGDNNLQLIFLQDSRFAGLSVIEVSDILSAINEAGTPSYRGWWKTPGCQYNSWGWWGKIRYEHILGRSLPELILECEHYDHDEYWDGMEQSYHSRQRKGLGWEWFDDPDMIQERVRTDFNAQLHLLGDLTNNGVLDNVTRNGAYIYNEKLDPKKAYGKWEKVHSVNSNAEWLIDINGDGFVDLVEVNDKEVRYFQGKGDGTFTARETLLSMSGSYRDTRRGFADINQNGLSDFYYIDDSGRLYVHYNFNGQISKNATLVYSGVHKPSKDDFVNFVDFAGNGRVSLVILRDGEAAQIYHGSFSSKLQYLTAVTSKYAPKVEFEYGFSHDEGHDLYVPQFFYHENRQQKTHLRTSSYDNPHGSFLISSVKVRDSKNVVTGHSSYRYGGQRIGRNFRGYLGMAMVNVKDELTGRELKERRHLIYPFNGQTALVEERLNGKILNKRTNSFCANGVSPSGSELKVSGVESCGVVVDADTEVNRWYTALIENVENAHDINEEQLTTSITKYANFDKFMNVGWINSRVTVKGGKEDGKNYTVRTVNKFGPPNINRWFIDRLLSSTVTHFKGDDEVSNTVSFGYDFASGLLTSEKGGDAEDNYRIYYTYDSYGNITRERTTGSHLESNREVVYSYNSNFPQLLDSKSITTRRFDIDGKKLSDVVHKSSYVYDEDTGLLLQEQAPGFHLGSAIQHSYDWLGYRTNTQMPWDIGVSTVSGRSADANACRAVTGGTTIDNFGWCEFVRPASEPANIIVYDIFGRPFRELRQSLQGKWIVIDKQYNNRGEIVATTRPYFEGQSSFFSVKHDYDEMGRLTKISEPGPLGESDSVTTLHYSPHQITRIDKLGAQKTEFYNVHGNTRKVITAGKADIEHNYYADGSLASTLHDGKYATSFAYNALGHKVRMTDPAAGTIQYGYNGVGELIVQTDALGTVTKSHYDELGRIYLQTRQGTKGRLEESRWEYDSTFIGQLAAERQRVAINGIWQPDEESILRYEYNFSSKGAGQLKKVTQELNDSVYGHQRFVTEYKYDETGRVIEEVRPDGFRQQNVYENGHLRAIKGPAGQHNLELSKEEIEQLIADALKHAELYANEAASLYSQAMDAKSWADEIVDASNNTMPVNGVDDVSFSRYKGMAHDIWESDLGFLLIETPELFVPIDGGLLSIVPLIPEFHHIYDPVSGNMEQISHDMYLQLINGVVSDKWGRFEKNESSKAWIGDLNDSGQLEIIIADVDEYGNNPFFKKEWNGSLSDLAREYNLAYQMLMGRYYDYLAAAEDMLSLATQLASMSSHFNRLFETETDRAERWESLADISDNPDAEIYYWLAQEVDASGRVKAEMFGNGVSSDYFYYEGTGQLHNIDTRGPASSGYGLSSQGWSRNLRFGYDRNDNMTVRENLTLGIKEKFAFDAAEQLISVSYRSSIAEVVGKGARFNENFTYDKRGNFKSKDGVAYQYSGRGYGPSKIGDKDVTYDANGAVTQIGNQYFVWGLAGQALKQHTGDNFAQFTYGTSGNRLRKVSGNGERLFYQGSSFEKRYTQGSEGLQVEYHNFINAGGRAIAVSMDIRKAEDESPISKEVHYFHKDSLGSITLVTNAIGEQVSQTLFDAWGKAREIEWDRHNLEQNKLFGSITNRGFTGHEHIPEVDLIHMNARVYSPEYGIFLSPDSVLQNPNNSHNYNRYSYVWNNPLKYHDPTGNFIGLVTSVVFGLMLKAGVHWAVVSTISFTMTYVVSRSFGLSPRDAFKAGLTAGIFSAVGAGFAEGGFLSNMIGENPLVKSLTHGVVGGGLNSLNGDSFSAGFFSAAFGKATSQASSLLDMIGGSGKFNAVGIDFGELAIAAIAGGAGSKMGGGSFTKGVQTASLANLFNSQSEAIKGLIDSGFAYKSASGRNSEAWYKMNFYRTAPIEIIYELHPRLRSWGDDRLARNDVYMEARNEWNISIVAKMFYSSEMVAHSINLAYQYASSAAQKNAFVKSLSVTGYFTKKSAEFMWEAYQQYGSYKELYDEFN